MTVKFCIVSGGWSVGYREKVNEKGPIRLKLSNHKPKIQVIAERLLCDVRDSFDKDPDSADKIWRIRTEVTAGCCPEILALSFSPTDCSIPQDLYIERVQPDEPIEEKYIFFHQIARYRFFLPVEKATQVFDLSNVSITDSLTVLCNEQQPTIRTILDKFIQDRLSNGLAITLKEGTYVWLKDSQQLI